MKQFCKFPINQKVIINAKYCRMLMYQPWSYLIIASSFDVILLNFICAFLTEVIRGRQTAAAAAAFSNGPAAAVASAPAPPPQQALPPNPQEAPHPPDNNMNLRSAGPASKMGDLEKAMDRLGMVRKFFGKSLRISFINVMIFIQVPAFVLSSQRLYRIHIASRTEAETPAVPPPTHPGDQKTLDHPYHPMRKTELAWSKMKTDSGSYPMSN